MPATSAADTYSWTVLWEMEQLRAMLCWLNPREWSRRTSFNLRMVSLFCDNWFLHLLVESSRHDCLASPFQSYADHRS